MKNTLASDILEMLDTDIVSRGLIAQCVKTAGEHDLHLPAGNEGKVLSELLESDKVEIGVPVQARPDYLEFIAWRGTVDDRVSRALELVANAIGHDKEFAYWLCLRKNVDRYEGEENQ